jgi:hypothetical protein
MHWNVCSRLGKGSVRDGTNALQEGTSSHAPEHNGPESGYVYPWDFTISMACNRVRFKFCSGMRNQLDHGKYTSLEVLTNQPNGKLTNGVDVAWSVQGQLKRVKFTYKRPQRTREGVEIQLYSFFNIGARWGGWSTPRPGRFTPGKDPVPIV